MAVGGRNVGATSSVIHQETNSPANAERSAGNGLFSGDTVRAVPTVERTGPWLRGDPGVTILTIVGWIPGVIAALLINVLAE